MAFATARRRSGFHGLFPRCVSARSTPRNAFAHDTSSGERGNATSAAVGGFVQSSSSRPAPGGLAGGFVIRSSRHHRFPGPARHRVDVEREPRRHEHQLDRDVRQAGGRVLPEEGEPDAAEDAGLGEPSVRQDEVARADERGLVGAKAGELQREIGFDADRAWPGPPWYCGQPPSACWSASKRSAIADRARGRCRPRSRLKYDVLRLHGHVRLERRVPVAVRVLRIDRPPHGGVDRRADARRAVRAARARRSTSPVHPRCSCRFLPPRVRVLSRPPRPRRAPSSRSDEAPPPPIRRRRRPR